jgi:hypothetical protein
MKKLLLSLVITFSAVFAAGGELPDNKPIVPPPISCDFESVVSYPFPIVRVERIYDTFKQEEVEYLVYDDKENKK